MRKLTNYFENNIVVTQILGPQDDEDFEILKVKKAAVMVHHRDACPEFPFEKDSNSEAKNKLFCEKCFCYICDIE